MENRRKFIKKLSALPALGSIAYASSAYGFDNFEADPLING